MTAEMDFFIYLLESFAGFKGRSAGTLLNDVLPIGLSQRGSPIEQLIGSALALVGFVGTFSVPRSI